MKKNIFLLIALTVLLGCEEPYQESHKYGNIYYITDRSDLSTVLRLIADGKNKVYKNDSINIAVFDTIQNNIIRFNADTLFYNGEGDYFNYEGDKTSNQDWREKDGEYYLKLLNPVPGKHLLSISIQNY